MRGFWERGGGIVVESSLSALRRLGIANGGRRWPLRFFLGSLFFFHWLRALHHHDRDAAAAGAERIHFRRRGTRQFRSAPASFSWRETAAAPALSWIDLGPVFQVPLGLTLDPLSRSMLFMVTGVGSLIHIYSLGYMRDRTRASRATSPGFRSSCSRCSGSCSRTISS